MKKLILLYVSLIAMLILSCGKNTSAHEGYNQDSISAHSEDIQNDVSKEREVSEANTPAIKLKITNIEDGAKVLGNQAGNSYHAKNMFDNNPATGWAIKLTNTQAESDRIYGPSMNVNARRLDHILIQNGYGKNRDSFLKNTRAKRIQIYRITDDEFPEDKDIIYDGPLKDSMEPQILKVNSEYDNSKPTKMVQITFPAYSKNNYYMGSKWDDLVISELEFYGVPNDSKH